MDLSLSTAASGEAFIKNMPRVDQAQYVGKVLLPGKDLTISVTPGKIAIYLDGRITKVGQAFRFVNAFAANIRRATSVEFESGSLQVNIIGVWHKNGPNNHSFEPYLTQKCDAAGKTETNLYRYNVFHFDHHRSGEDHLVDIGDLNGPADATDTIEKFKEATESLVPIDEVPEWVLANGYPDGILWCPLPGTGLPPFAYRAIGLRKFRKSNGDEMKPDEVLVHFDHAKHKRNHDMYMGLLEMTASKSSTAH